MHRKLIATIAALFVATAAHAATVTNIGGVADVDAGAGVTLVGASFTTSPTIETVSVSGVTRSVYEGTAGYGQSYFNIGKGGSATLKLGSAATSVEFLWGSPDIYNSVTLMLGSTIVATVAGDGVPGAVVGRGAVLVHIADALFDTIVFASASPAFEFSNIRASIVPLPATGLLLFAGLGGLALVRRRDA